MTGNGIDTGPLAGWVILTEQGIRYLGRRDRDSEGIAILRPAYELLVGIGQAPNGQLMITRQAIPIMTFASIESWTPRDDASVIEVASLSAVERRELLKAVMIAENTIKGLRSAETGLTIATDMPKIDAAAILRRKT